MTYRQQITAKIQARSKRRCPRCSSRRYYRLNNGDYGCLSCTYLHSRDKKPNAYEF